MGRAVTFDWFSEARSEDLSSQLRLIGRMREGIPFQDLASVIDRIGLSQEQAAQVLHIPLRTLARRKEKADRLAPDEGERFVRFVKILSIAQDALGSMEAAKGWMGRENRALSGATPASLLDTEIGARAVEDILGRIEYGIHS